MDDGALDLGNTRAGPSAEPAGGLFLFEDQRSVSIASQDSQGSLRTFSVLVENRFGVLSRIAGLFSARGYNIENLTVAGINDSTLSRITMVVRCEPRLAEQILKQVNKLVEVVKAVELTDSDCVERELLLVRVKAVEDKRSTLLNEAAIFRARVVTATPENYVFEVTGDSPKIDAFLEVVSAFGIDEMVRTGKIALLRGSRAKNKKSKPLTFSANSWTEGD